MAGAVAASHLAKETLATAPRPSDGCKSHSEMNSKLESPALKFAGEPSTGNLYTRFDEGRGGLAFGLAPSSTLPVDLQLKGKVQ